MPLESPIRCNADVDLPNQRIVVGKGSAYDLYLTRELKNATLVRAPTSPSVIEVFLEIKSEVAAGIYPRPMLAVCDAC